MQRTRSTTSSQSTKRADYVLVAVSFAEDIVADRARAKYCKWTRLAAKRFLADMRRAQRKRPPFVFSATRANHACAFVERLPHVEGRWDTETIKLEPFQILFLVSLFGFRSLSGGRRFTVALLAIARKNAKSTFAAAILLYVFCCEPELGPQVFSAATTGAQARIVWGIAQRMVQRLPALQTAFSLETFANAIVRYEAGGSFRPINAKASTQDGLNPSAFCLDELHAHKTHDLRNVLTSAAGARVNPLFLYTTTEGYESPGPWAEERNFAEQLLLGVHKAEHYLAHIYALDDDDYEFDTSKWIKANPLIPANPNLAEAIRRDAIEAKQKPGAFAEFRIKRLNRRSETARGWVNLSKWRKCGGAVDLDALAGTHCWAAFDLASTTDMTAWRLLWLSEGVFYTWGRYWVPESAVQQRTERNTVPYASWVQSGALSQTQGDVTDYEVIRLQILEDCERFAPSVVAFDPWNAAQLANELSAQGLPLQAFRQGPASFNSAMHAFERAYTSGALCHADNPVLTWNMANLVPRYDANMNLAPDRKRSADKIDGAVALLMAFGCAETEKVEDIGGFLANPMIAQ